MKFLILCALVVAVSAYHHNHHEYEEPKHFSGKAIMRGDIVFEGCVEETCKRGDYKGYGCRGGHCATICTPHGCYENRSFKQAYGEKWGDEEAHGKRFQKGGEKGQSQYKGHVQFGGKVEFSGCSSDYCNNGEVEGYNCKNGHCSTVCKGSECLEEKEY
uniref:Chorion class high-cysteine protein 12-like n=1 Tax=Schyzocotyle acheilognathi TaxID=135513 RepID=Q5VKI8_SCHAC|nr:chorion class high-cysteine protein 12-like precursor [Schyzocotyle acheilognathi]